MVGSNVRQVTRSETSIVWDRSEGECRPGLKKAPLGKERDTQGADRGSPYPKQVLIQEPAGVIENVELGRPGIVFALAVMATGKQQQKSKTQAEPEAKVKASKSLCDMELGGLKSPVSAGLSPLIPVYETVDFGPRTASVTVTGSSEREPFGGRICFTLFYPFQEFF